MFEMKKVYTFFYQLNTEGNKLLGAGEINPCMNKLTLLVILQFGIVTFKALCNQYNCVV